MLEKLEILQMAHAMSKHAAQRQNLVSQNIANADTPGYRARDVASFADTYQSQSSDWNSRATRDGHFTAASAGPMANMRAIERDDPGTQSPNGNSVSLELEMVNAAEVKRQHDRALTVYKYSLDMMRTALGRGR